jgi:hypothetical protein
MVGVAWRHPPCDIPVVVCAVIEREEWPHVEIELAKHVWLGWVGLAGVIGEEGDSVDADADERVIVISAPMASIAATRLWPCEGVCEHVTE